MERERISALLRATPPGLAAPEPDYPSLLRRVRRRRVRRLAGTSLVAAVAVAGLVLPLTQLAGVGRPAHEGHVPGAGGESRRASNVSGTAGEPVGSFSCTASGVDATAPRFAVQPDGIHLHIENPGGAATFVLRTPDGTQSYPVGLSDTADTDLITPYLRPGEYRAACTDQPVGQARTASGVRGSALAVIVSDPEGLWTDPTLDCTSHRERIFLTGRQVAGREDVLPLIRTSVVGLTDSDRIVPAAYPESTRDIQYLVERDGAAVALIRLGARDLPVDDAGLDVTSCDGSGIAEGQGAR